MESHSAIFGFRMSESLPAFSENVWEQLVKTKSPECLKGTLFRPVVAKLMCERAQVVFGRLLHGIGGQGSTDAHEVEDQGSRVALARGDQRAEAKKSLWQSMQISGLSTRRGAFTLVLPLALVVDGGVGQYIGQQMKHLRIPQHVDRHTAPAV